MPASMPPAPDKMDRALIERMKDTKHSATTGSRLAALLSQTFMYPLGAAAIVDGMNSSNRSPYRIPGKQRSWAQALRNVHNSGKGLSKYALGLGYGNAELAAQGKEDMERVE